MSLPRRLQPAPVLAAVKATPCGRTRSACPRSTVRGEMIRRSWLRCRWGSSRASTDRIARSAQDSLGALTWRWSTTIWWRRTQDLGVFSQI